MMNHNGGIPRDPRVAHTSAVAALAATLLLVGCDLTEKSLTEPLPNVVVESFVRVAPAGGGRIFALLHGSVGVPGANPGGPEASIRVIDEAGVAIPLQETGEEACAYDEGPGPDPRRCYEADLPASFVRPGDRLTLEVDVTGGGRIEGGTVIPGAFAWAEPAASVTNPNCSVAAGAFAIQWTPSDGTWAYLADMTLVGVADPLRALGVTNPEDTVALFGVSVTRDDTEIEFPENFDVDSSVDYELRLAEVLEAGLQAGMHGTAFVSAIDRNFTNWVRDQVFNPSGQVRIPSLRGDGTGVFGSSVNLEQRVVSRASDCGK